MGGKIWPICYRKNVSVDGVDEIWLATRGALFWLYRHLEDLSRVEYHW